MPEFSFLDGTLLVKALEPIVDVGYEGIINYSLEELSLLVQTPSGLLIAALRIRPSQILFFQCNVNSFAYLNIALFHQLLMFLVSDEDILTIYGGEGDYIHFDSRRFEEDTYYNEMIVGPFGNENTVVYSFQYEYEVVVGIPADEFNNIIQCLCGIGGPVNTTIRDTEVIFEAGDEEIILSIENNECIIGGVAEGDSFPFVFDVNHPNSLWLALHLSGSVWMFQSETCPYLLNFPVKELGNIMFYFP